MNNIEDAYTVIRDLHLPSLLRQSWTWQASSDQRRCSCRKKGTTLQGKPIHFLVLHRIHFA